MNINEAKLLARSKIYEHIDDIIEHAMELVRKNDPRTINTLLDKIIPSLANVSGEATDDLQQESKLSGLSGDTVEFIERAIKRDMLGIHEVKSEQTGQFKSEQIGQLDLFSDEG